MAHDHHHHDEGNYYVEQLCTIGVCGALAGVAIVLWYRDYLEPDKHLGFLHPNFRLPLLLGGIALLVLVAIRAVVVWVASGRRAAHVHNHDHAHDHHHEHGEACGHHHHHEHGPGCGHDHDHAHEHTHAPAGHTHDHGHSHGWGPWRYSLLLFPIMLFFLNLPPAGFNYLHGGTMRLDDIKPEVVENRGAVGREMTFMELTGAADNPDRRATLLGKTIEVKGQVSQSGGDQQFVLVRMRITCCGADAIPLQVPVFIKPKDPKSQEKLNIDALASKWVRVTGQIQFVSRKVKGGEQWMLVVVAQPDDTTPLRDLVVELAPNERPPAYEYSAVSPAKMPDPVCGLPT